MLYLALLWDLSLDVGAEGSAVEGSEWCVVWKGVEGSEWWGGVGCGVEGCGVAVGLCCI